MLKAGENNFKQNIFILLLSLRMLCEYAEYLPALYPPSLGLCEIFLKYALTKKDVATALFRRSSFVALSRTFVLQMENFISYIVF
jgi:hypothetical protein